MRALIVSDLHLTLNPSEAYRWRIFEWLRSAAKNPKIDAVFICGDLTDEKDEHASKLVNRIVRELTRLKDECDVFVFVLKGNHDYLDPKAPYFEFLNTADERLAFVSEPRFETFDGCRVAFLPHTRTPVEDFKKAKYVLGRAELVLMHQTVKGAKASNGRELDGELTAEWLAKRTGKGVPIVSGDIHVPQMIGRVIYVGAPHPVKFGDNYKPRALLFDSAAHEKVTSLPIESIRRVELTTEGEQHLLQVCGTPGSLPKGSHIRVTVKLKRGEYGLWPTIRKRLRAQAKELSLVLFSCECEPVDGDAEKVHAKKATDLAKPQERVEEFVRAHKYARGLKDSGKRFLNAALEVPGTVKRRTPGDIVFDSIEIHGFGSYKKTQRLRFPSEPGLNFMGGRNLVAPEMGGNATGKSRLWAALAWCLWGKTPRGERGPDIVNWSDKHKCRVVVHGSKGGKSFVVDRTQKPNKLYLGREVGDVALVTQDELTRALGLSLDEFLYSGLMGQFGTFFLDLDKLARLELVSRVLGLDVWVGAAKAASEAHAASEMAIQGLREVRERAKGQLVVARAHLGEERKKLLDIERRTLAASKEHERTVRDAKERHEDLKGAWDQLLKEKRKAFIELGYAQRDFDCFEKTYEIERKRTEMAQDALAIAIARTGALRRAIDGFVEAGRCPACRQQVSAEHVKAEKAALLVEFDRLSDLEADARKKYLEVKKFEDERTKRGARLRERVEEHKVELARLEEKIPAERRDMDAAKDAIVAAERVGAFVKEAQDDQTSVVRAANVKVRRFRLALAEHQNEIETKTQEQADAKFWRTGFRELRLWLMRAALDEMEIESNNGLDQLGLKGWRIVYDVERATKAKTISRGLHVFIENPYTKKRMRWETWSGGETQRLRVAGAVGLAHVIGNRTGVSTNMETWDEPTQGLHERGIRDMLAYFERRARRESKVLWLIDHHSLTYGGFANEYVVVLKKSGSRIVRKARSDGE